MVWMEVGMGLVEEVLEVGEEDCFLGSLGGFVQKATALYMLEGVRELALIELGDELRYDSNIEYHFEHLIAHRGYVYL